MATLYGIPNCDTVKKARTWLTERGIDVSFHDFKKGGVSPALLDTWMKQVEWEVLVNRKGTTWRGLPQDIRDGIADSASAKKLMLEFPSVIKRPVLDANGRIHVGFSDSAYQQIFE